MHGETHKPLCGIGHRGTGVKTHANPKGSSVTEVDVRKRPLRFQSGSDSLLGLRKSHEHAVAARSELVAAVSTER